MMYNALHIMQLDIYIMNIYASDETYFSQSTSPTSPRITPLPLPFSIFDAVHHSTSPDDSIRPFPLLGLVGFVS